MTPEQQALWDSQPRSIRWTPFFVLFAAVVSIICVVAEMTIILWANGKPVSETEVWMGLLPSFHTLYGCCATTMISGVLVWYQVLEEMRNLAPARAR